MFYFLKTNFIFFHAAFDFADFVEAATIIPSYFRPAFFVGCQLPLTLGVLGSHIRASGYSNASGRSLQGVHWWENGTSGLGTSHETSQKPPDLQLFSLTLNFQEVQLKAWGFLSVKDGRDEASPTPFVSGGCRVIVSTWLISYNVKIKCCIMLVLYMLCILICIHVYIHIYIYCIYMYLYCYWQIDTYVHSPCFCFRHLYWFNINCSDFHILVVVQTKSSNGKASDWLYSMSS